MVPRPHGDLPPDLLFRERHLRGPAGAAEFDACPRSEPPDVDLLVLRILLELLQSLLEFLEPDLRICWKLLLDMKC